MNSIKYRILLRFGILGAIIIALCGTAVSWKLNQSISQRTQMLEDDVKVNTYQTLDGHHEIFKFFINNTKELTLHKAGDLCENPAVKTIIENKLFDSLNDYFQSKFETTEIDFIFIYNLQGELQASYPSTVEKAFIEKYYLTQELESSIQASLQGRQNKDSQLIFVFKVNSDFLKACDLSNRGSGQSGISIVSARIIKDDFGEPLSICVLGTLLNNQHTFLKQLFEATGSACLIFLDSSPIAQAGFSYQIGDNIQLDKLRISPEELKQVYKADKPININLTLAGEIHLTTCSALISTSGEKIGLICVGVLESKIMAACQYDLDTKKKVGIWIWGIGIATLIIFIIISLIITRTITVPLKKMVKIAGEVCNGNYDIDMPDAQCLESVSMDEIGQLGNSMVSMVENLKNVVYQANSIATGDYSSKITPRSETDMIALALQKMTDNLMQTSEENEKERWLKIGQAELNEKMRGELDIGTLGNNVISYLAEYLNCRVGAIYNSNEKKRLKVIGAYAWSRRKSLNNEFMPGEGLVGQAALEKKPIVVTKCPDDYISIHSGLGEAAPNNILVYPLKINEELKGIIELGSFDDFSELAMTFLDLVADSIAIVLSSIEARQQTTLLLEQTRKQAEVLQTQQEELRVTNEGLEEQARALKGSEERLQQQQEELRQTNEELEEQTKALKVSEERLQQQQEELRQTNEELEESAEQIAQQKNEVEQKNTNLEKAKKQIEDKAKELEITGKYKSEFLANMSHELRTPLNSLLILSKNLSENKKGNLLERQVEYAFTIHSCGVDLLNLINDILDLSKVEAGKIQLNIEDVPLEEFTTTIAQIFTPVIEEKNLTLDINIAQGLPKYITTDPQRVNQIIKNLLSNAIKFTHEGGITVDISRPYQSIDLSDNGFNLEKGIAFSVIDTGVGIPEDKQRLIFEAFQQEDGSISREYGGTGLGLSISREMAKLLGGEIRLRSEKGKGSTFTLYLPEVTREKEESESDKEEEKIPLLVSVDQQKMRDQNTGSVGNTPTYQASEQKTASIDVVTTPTGQASENKTAPSSAGTTTTDQGPEHNAAPIDLGTTKPLKASEHKIGRIADNRRDIKPGDKSILIVEDDHNFSKILFDISHEKGYKSIVAEDGETGLQLADYHKPSAIILDISLPGIDGWTVMERLKNNPITRNIPVHFISGSERNIKGLKMGAVGFLTKPVTMEGLDDAFVKIEDVLSRDIKKILLAENKGQKNSILNFINNKNINVVVSSSGLDAYNKLKVENFDCIIFDPFIEDREEFDLLEKIKNDRTINRIPILIFANEDLPRELEVKIIKYAEDIIIKKIKAPEILLDEVVLFLHLVEEKLPQEKQRALRMVHDKESIIKDKTILLVDDDIRNVFALSSILEEKGMIVTVARDGKEALDCLDKNPDLSLVLMDVMMPIMDGIKSMQEIRKQPRFRNLPIIALTAKAMRGDRNICIEAGANDYLTKPIDTDKLMSTMRVWLYKEGNKCGIS